MREKKKLQANTLAYVFVVLVSFLLLFVGNRTFTKQLTIFSQGQDVPNAPASEKVKITKELNREYVANPINPHLEDISLVLEGTLLTGENKGKPITLTATLQTPPNGKAPSLAKGDKVMATRMDMGGGQMRWVTTTILRAGHFVWLFALFFVLLIFFGKAQGFHTIVSLSFTCLSIFLVFIPSILAGVNIYASAMLVCVYIILMTLIIISGWSEKSLAAAIGCFGGVAIAGMLTLLLSGILKITGVVDDQSIYLTFINPEHPINVKAIVFAGVIIGALGATMDVAMSIASSLQEVCLQMQAPRYKDIVKSGIRIGRDIMGTMANTLILAYIGGSLTSILLLITYETSLISLMNLESIVTELTQALVGSFGILFTIPVTAVVCGLLYPHLLPKKGEKNGEKIV